MTNTSHLAQRYLTALTEHLGIDAEVTDTGHVSFSPAPGVRFLAGLRAYDPEYFSLVRHLGVAQVGGDMPLLYELVNRANRGSMGAKVVAFDGGGVMIEVPSLVAGTERLPTVDHLANILPRAMAIQSTAAQTFETDVEFRRITARE